ncbi:hypothetical protein [Comamonas terrae]|uniref:Transcriptional regulator n=1 Tax=Comamonas terrae TaxID=673548 RepID=A0ABW5UNX0_9BURK|nr:hypothetical protein [Comamonas terrae]
MTDKHLQDPEAMRLAAAAPQDEELEPIPGQEQLDLDNLCEQWVAWKSTRRFYGPPAKMGSILGQLSGSRTRALKTDGPDAYCSAELAAFHLAYTCQPDALDKWVFDLYYVHRITPVKTAAAALNISRQHFYLVLGEFRKRVHAASLAVLETNLKKGALSNEKVSAPDMTL